MRKGLSFTLDDNQADKLDAFINRVNAEKIEEQKQSDEWKDHVVAQECWAMGYPYSGAIGGALTWIVTQTSIGMVIKVQYFGEELDITDYDSW